MYIHISEKLHFNCKMHIIILVRRLINIPLTSKIPAAYDILYTRNQRKNPTNLSDMSIPQNIYEPETS